MSEAKLPEEIVRDILRLLLTPSPDAFFKFPGNTAIPRWSAEFRFASWIDFDADDVDSQAAALLRPSDVLLVSKRWLRIGTPLLYNSLRIWNSRQTKAIAQLFAASPQVGTAVRCLRIEGGMGKDFVTVVKNAPNIHSLYVSLYLKSSDSVTGLRKGLSLINPTALYMQGGYYRHSKLYYEALGLIQTAIEKTWTRLSCITFGGVIRMTPEFAQILRKASSLATIDIVRCDTFHDWIRNGHLATIGLNSNIKQIRYHGTHDRDKILDSMARAQVPDNITSRMVFIETAHDRDLDEFVARLIAHERGDEDEDEDTE